MRLTQELLKQGISEKLLDDIKYFKHFYKLEESLQERGPSTETVFYGKDIWSMCITAILEGENILLSGPKATGKNVLADNICELFNRPQWNTSFHVNTDSSSLIGTDTFIDNEVRLRRGV